MGKKKKPASKKGGANKKGKSDDIGVDNVETNNDGDEDTAASDDVLEKKSKTAAKKPAAKKKGKSVDVEADGVAQDEDEVIPAVLEKKPKKASTKKKGTKA